MLNSRPALSLKALGVIVLRFKVVTYSTRPEKLVLAVSALRGKLCHFLIGALVREVSQLVRLGRMFCICRV